MIDMTLYGMTPKELAHYIWQVYVSPLIANNLI
jgi:hypothetical protein